MDIIAFLLDYGYIIAILALILVLGLLFRKKSSNIKGNTIFIIGDNGTGKTSLLYLLATKSEVRTVSSLVQNETKIDIKFGDKVTTLDAVDIPGHNHTKEIFFNRIKEAKNIIFMIDSANPESWTRSAEFLYRIMINKLYQEMEIPTLLVLNKQDEPKAKKIPEIEEALIKEIERIKKSKRAISEDNEENRDYLKNDESTFSFQGKGKIKFCVASIKNMEISEVESFLRSDLK